MLPHRIWRRRLLAGALLIVACHQIWRHGQDYVFIDKFAVVVPGRIYRGAWQQDWPMHRLVRDYQIKTVVALAHPPESPLVAKEKALADELGFRWIHIPIVDRRATGVSRSLLDSLEKAADELAAPENQPVYFHCHHGINRASMVQIAYRTLHCGWTLERATEEISRSFGLKEVAHGPDYRQMTAFYNERVLPRRQTRLNQRAPDGLSLRTLISGN
ncbi:Tyrosine phosphatase family protein [Singulisphaera sp. GP187]|uniref:phosphatase domain-containing putative toxin n=1 Tax=Singulisphaera sp. GP187 TaxID=1882752 RepID=UPI0009270401|nr:dual specificity protein phosphatase family protein [Singulisphaera sp. GP187]SIO03398.1 Tyrosine phosphatase family protein [Singulisphaera sp. GP187]